MQNTAEVVESSSYLFCPISIKVARKAYLKVGGSGLITSDYLGLEEVKHDSFHAFAWYNARDNYFHILHDYVIFYVGQSLFQSQALMSDISSDVHK